MEEAWRVSEKVALNTGIFIFGYLEQFRLAILSGVSVGKLLFFFLKIGHVFLGFQTDWNKVAHDVLFAPKFYFWKYLSYR